MLCFHSFALQKRSLVKENDYIRSAVVVNLLLLFWCLQVVGSTRRHAGKGTSENRKS